MIKAFTRGILGSIGMILTMAPCASAQQLANTTWEVYYQGNLASYVHFDGSVLSVSLDNASYSDISSYTDNSGNFTLEDLTGSCAGMTGTYTYVVDGDELNWALVSDACPTRSDFFVLNDWVSLSIGIGTPAMSDPMVVFPNPAEDGIHISSNQALSGEPYTLCDGMGKVVSTGSLRGTQDVIDVAHLGPGTYILRVGYGALAPLRIMKR